ncbi:MAG: bacterioferritin-associated ferredoxin [Acetobacteraceae bacterium]
MYVCLCNALTDQRVRDAAEAGATRPSQIYGACGCVVQCGGCAPTLRRILNESVANAASPDLLAAD